MKRGLYLLLAAGVVAAGAYLVAERWADDVATSQRSVSTNPDYVGAQTCAQCHQGEYELWRGSHHDLAMQHASEETVLADFGDKRFEYFGTSSRFFTEEDRFFVRTDGPDGKLHDYQVKYTFGVEPLQQYLVELDGGRLQALHLAWDTRPKEQGGQRWFHLYPDEKIDHADELHWTKLAQNWNHMCAECHSTNLKKNFDLEANQFNTTWSEINVACEACHGPGSAHVAWANKEPGWKKLNDKGFSVIFDERRGVSWGIDGNLTTARRSEQRETNKEIETCARCHSRRSLLSEDYQHGKPLMDTHLPALLTAQLYHADGQVKDEVYVYGSFLQSKMFHKGVTCSDCHEPHSAKLRATGNRVCTQCHEPSHYNSTRHHFHGADGEGSRCVSCHMPAKKFMVIDERNDHSFRIPRPDLSMRIDAPYACMQCHPDKSAEWAASRLKLFFGPDWQPGWHFGEALHAGRVGMPGAGRELAALATSPKYPDIARATAASLLVEYPGRETSAALPRLLGDASPLVREAALRMVEGVDMERRWELAGTLLSDPIFAVRIEAARVLAAVDRGMLTPQQQALLDRAIDEYVGAQNANAEHPQSHLNLGLLRVRLRDFTGAEADYRQALRLDPDYAAAYVNLSDLYRLQGDERQVGQVLTNAQSRLPGNAAIAHSLGLHLVRAGKPKQALESLERATALAPDDARYAYVFAVALRDAGRVSKAIAVLEKVHQSHPYDVDVLVALVSFSASAGDDRTAQRYAERLAQVEPRLGSADEILARFADRR